MRKRKPVRMPESFSALLNYLQSKGYADASIRYFEGHFRNISIFMEDNGYASYTLEAYEYDKHLLQFVNSCITSMKQEK